MKKVNKKSLLTLVECAMLVAIAVVIDLIPFPKWPQGGSVSLCMIPIVFCSYRHGWKTGVLCGFLLSCIQMLTGFYIPPAGDAISIILCVLLDYVLAFSFLGLADIVKNLFGQREKAGYLFGVLFSGVLRFICSFLSGIVLYGSYAPEGTPVWIYSLIYNGSYMLPNTVIAAIIILILCSVINPKTLKKA